MKRLVIYAADIGSVRKNRFAWWRSPSILREADAFRHPRHLVAAVEADLQAGLPIALGFECPLWVDLREDAEDLTRARDGEGNRPWSAGAGCGALATGIVQVEWILRKMRQAADATAFLRWSEFVQAGRGLFLWEAFVTGSAKGRDHLDDATRAVAAFDAALPDPERCRRVRPRGANVISLVGAALLRSGWARDATVLHEPCLVISATESGAAGSPTPAGG